MIKTHFDLFLLDVVRFGHFDGGAVHVTYIDYNYAFETSDTLRAAVFKNLFYYEKCLKRAITNF